MLRPHIEERSCARPPWEVFRTACRSSPAAFFLDSIDYRPPDQAYSYLGAGPVLELKIPAPRAHTEPKLRVSGPGRRPEVRPARELFEALRSLLARYRTPASPRGFFTGGAVGYWGYDLATLFERLPRRPKPDPATPWLYLGLFMDVVVYDHRRGLYYLVVNLEKKEGRSALKKRMDRLDRWLQGRPEGRPQGRDSRGFKIEKFRPEISRARFESMVRRAKAYIRAGDIYQANLSQRFSFRFRGSALDLYGRLREINPSPFASFLQMGDLRVISSSPERLVRKSGRACQTRPIAGTRPRVLPKRGARDLERDLLESRKERAEHVMLVDLERNDLGRVCGWDSVRVEEFMTLERYSHVVHIVSKIAGRLRRDRDGLDLIAAMFPGGTITGCPKIRCMEVIDELEPVRRGIYTGSIGYLDFRGDLDLNIVIRTIVLEKNSGYYQVGAGIVHDSRPAREFEETLHKGGALREALLGKCRNPLIPARSPDRVDPCYAGGGR